MFHIKSLVLVLVLSAFSFSVSAECLSGAHKIRQISQGHGNSPSIEIYGNTIQKDDSGSYGSKLLDDVILSGQLKYWKFEDLGVSDAKDRLWSMILTVFASGDLIKLCHSANHSEGAAFVTYSNGTKRLLIDSIHIIKN